MAKNFDLIVIGTGSAASAIAYKMPSGRLEWSRHSSKSVGSFCLVGR